MTQTPTDALRLVQDEYVLVPREPTGAMLKAAFAAMNSTPSGTWKRMKAEARHPIQIFNAKMRPRWAAMIGAAPSNAEIPWQHRRIEDDGVGGYRYAPASPLPEGGGCLGAEHLSAAITRLTQVVAGDEVEAAYADFTFPGHTFRADIRALLSALPAAPTGAK